MVSLWGDGRQLPVVLQNESAECALACLTMICKFHQKDVSLAGLRRLLGSSVRGARLSNLVQMAGQLGFESRALRAELDYLRHAQTPCVLHWDLNHFVVLKRVRKDSVEIHDPAIGLRRLRLDEISRHFTGIILELSPSASFEPVAVKDSISLRALTGKVFGAKRVLLQVLVLAFVIEILALALPFHLQTVMDTVLLTGQSSLLTTLAFAFLTLIIVSSALSFARAYIISWLGASIQSQWTSNLFGHLLNLPTAFFERRSIGDLLSRFSSIHSIQSVVTGSFVEAVLDGLMATLALGILLWYSVSLTVVVAVSFLLYLSVRWIMYRSQWLVNEELLVCLARQQTEIMESIRGIQTIRLAGKRSERLSRMANMTNDAADRSMRGQRLSLVFGIISQRLSDAERVILVTAGAYLVMKGSLSVGMLVAYLAYSFQFSSKAKSLADKLVDFRMLRLHAERISDIALEPPERNTARRRTGSPLEPHINVRNLGFRYADTEPWIFRGINIEIREGESVAIVGPSGCGKTTLIKVIMGLLEPTEGAVEVGGVDIRDVGLDAYRAMIATVMQDDILFSGSIADNISLFDESSDLDDIIEAASKAELHRDIMAMPMGYETLVGDMGSALSGGQRQRVVLARALFRKPKILFLDEATSHLDPAREKAIDLQIRREKMTRILVAHRPGTIESADRVISISDEPLAAVSCEQ